MSLQWCLDNPVHIQSNHRIITFLDSIFAFSRASTKGKLKSQATYAQHFRELLQCVKDRYPSVTVTFHKVEGYSARNYREARGNNRVDSLAKSGAEKYVSGQLPRPRPPPSVIRRSVCPLPATPGRTRHRPFTNNPRLPGHRRSPLSHRSLQAPCGVHYVVV